MFQVFGSSGRTRFELARPETGFARTEQAIVTPRFECDSRSSIQTGCPVRAAPERRGLNSRLAIELDSSPSSDTIIVVRVVEAQYDDGVLRPAERLGLRPGERVNLIVVRRPDPRRWDTARLAQAANGDDLGLAEQGLAEWASDLDSTEHS